MRPFSVLTLCLSLGAGSLHAQSETCAYRDDIVEASWTVLDTRTELTGFAPRRAGLDAAYLALRYSDAPDINRVVAALQAGTRPAIQTGDLFLTFDIWARGPVALEDHEDPVATVVTGWPSIRRALILTDAGQTYLTYMTEAQSRDDLPSNQSREFGFAPQTAALVMDQSDAFKLAFAKHANAAGFTVLAAFVISDTSDRGAFARQIATMDPDDAGFLDQMHPEWSGLSILSGLGPVAPRQNSLDAYRIMQSGLYLSPIDYLGIFVNQTGQTDAVAYAIDQLEAAAQAGAFDPQTDMHTAWLIAFDALVNHSGADTVTRALSGFDMPPARIRHFAGPFALGSLQGMAASERLGPFVAGAISEIPAPHPHLPYPEGWVATAEALVNGDDVPVENMAIAAELLFSADRIDLALGVQSRPLVDRVKDESIWL